MWRTDRQTPRYSVGRAVQCRAAKNGSYFPVHCVYTVEKTKTFICTRAKHTKLQVQWTRTHTAVTLCWRSSGGHLQPVFLRRFRRHLFLRLHGRWCFVVGRTITYTHSRVSRQTCVLDKVFEIQCLIDKIPNSSDQRIHRSLFALHTEQVVKVIWQKASHGGPIPRLKVTPGGRKLYHWIPGVAFPISVP